MTGKRKGNLYGVGTRKEETQITVNGKRTRLYVLWSEMLKRCFCEKEKERIKSYKNSKCCEEWRSFEKFKEWAEPLYKEGWELDKDILVAGNNLYSPETCLIVPARINSMAVIQGKGYYWNKKMQMWHAQIATGTRKERKTLHLGFFAAEKDADEAYKNARRKLLLSRSDELDAVDERILPCLLGRLDND